MRDKPSLLRLRVESVDVLSSSEETIELQFRTHPQVPKSVFMDRIVAAETAIEILRWLELYKKTDE